MGCFDGYFSSISCLRQPNSLSYLGLSMEKYIDLHSMSLHGIIRLNSEGITSGSLRSSDNSGSLSSYTSAKDAIALTVGRSAHHYLQECFTTEVSILDRDKFDAVPEIVKSDLLIAVSHQTTDCPPAAMHARLTTILCCPTLFSGIWEREAIVMFSKSFVKLVT